MTIAIALTRSTVATDVAESFTGFDDVLDGDPAARVAWLRTGSGGEGMLFTGMFTAEPSTFRYTFAAHCIVCTIDFASEAEAAEFARAFDGRIVAPTAGPPLTTPP